MSFDLLAALVGIAYALATAPAVLALMGREVAAPLRTAAQLALLVALASHLALISGSLVPDGVGIGTSLSLAALCCAVVLALLSLRRPVQHLALLVLPLAAVGALSTGSGGVGGEELSPAVMLHVLLSMLAYALLALAVAQALTYAWSDARLRSHREVRLGRLPMPALDAQEDLLFLLLAIGFVLLTLSLASGLGFITDLRAQHLVHKTVLTVVAWLVLGALLAGRHLRGWRGQQAVRWVLVAFAILVLGYFGSKFVLEVILGRSWG